MRSAQNALDGTRQDKKKASGPKRREKLEELIKKGQLVLDYIQQGESQAAEQRNARITAFRNAYDALTKSHCNYGFKTDTATNKLYSADDILNGKYWRASIDGNADSELFVVDCETLQNLFGPKARVSESVDGGYDVRLPNGLKAHITENETIEMPEGSIVRGYGREAAERVRSGKSKVADSYYSQDGVAFIDLLRGGATNSTMSHEMFHWVSDMLLTPEQRRTLWARFGGKDVSLDQFEENMANGFADWKAGRSQPTSTVHAIFRRIAGFFSRLRSMFTGDNVEDIFRNVESGRIWEQGGSQSGSFRRPLLISKAGAAALDAADGADVRWNSLSRARQMERNGATTRDIWQETGWEHDPQSGKWITEIYDSPRMASRLFDMAPGDVKKLNEVLDNPALYRAFPELAGVNVVAFAEDSNMIGQFRPRTNTIYINIHDNLSAPDIVRAFVHEVQHAVQPKENMPSGYTPEEGLALARNRLGNALPEETLVTLADDIYNHNKGEIDARNVSKRLFMDQDGRAFIPPSETLDLNDNLVWPTTERGDYFDGYSLDPENRANGRGTSYYRREQESSSNGTGEMDSGGRTDEIRPGYEPGRGSTGASDVSTYEPSGSPRINVEDSDQGMPRLDRGTDSARDSLVDNAEEQATPTRRPSIVTTSEEARREGERVVSEGKKNVSTISKYLEPNGGNGIGQRVLDAVVPLVFNANRMVGRILGWDVFDRLERGLATSPGKAVYKIEHGDAGAGIKGFGEILGDIPAELRDRFETIAAYFNLRDIAGDRRLLMEQRDNLKALARDELFNAAIIRRDLRKNRALDSGEEIRQDEDAIEGCRRMAREYAKEASEIQKNLARKQTVKTADWYDAEIKKALAEHPEWEGKIQDLIKWGQYQLQEFVDMGVVSEETSV